MIEFTDDSCITKGESYYAQHFVILSHIAESINKGAGAIMISVANRSVILDAINTQYKKLREEAIIKGYAIEKEENKK